MADIIKLNDNFFATCRCGSNVFYLPVNGPGKTWDKIIGSQCANCGENVSWTKPSRDDNEAKSG